MQAFSFVKRFTVSPFGQILLTSLVIMLLELICIRWIGSIIRLFGFFVNFVLLASLLGIGVGVLASGRKMITRLPFPMIILVLVVFAIRLQFGFSIPTAQVLFYGNENQVNSENWIALPFIFGLITLLFIPLGQMLGRLFREAKPLVAYTADIIGSLIGIAIFTALSWFSTPPHVWFGVLAIFSLLILRKEHHLVSLVAFMAIITTSLNLPATDIWSSYYRIRYEPIEGGYGISVNNIGHQTALPSEMKETFYHRPYDVFGKAAFKKVLIIGAGTGSDVSLALRNGAERVVAVEIDRELYQLGRQLHPEKPYDDPRVNVVIDDGRAYMRHTEEKFDLIVFALTDSLVLTSGYANLRLESFIYTLESIKNARQRLSDTGLLVLYNYYREDWSIQKLAGMMQTAFEQPPFVTSYGAQGKAAVLLAGPRLAQLPAALDKPFTEGGEYVAGQGAPLPVVGMGRMEGTKSVRLSTDDWPFFYLKEQSLPDLYRLPILGVLVFSAVLIFTTTPKGTLRSFSPDLFFMGAAFMLLEARSLVTFALLFGTTWMVNALVFFAILLSVLLSILISSKVQFKRTEPLYAVLFGLLVANYFISPDEFLNISTSAVRYTAVAVFTFAPVFLANLIFSQAFSKVTRPETAFAWNLIGIMLGGLLEYAALVTGYRGLLLIVIASYAAAFIAAILKKRTLQAASSPAEG